MKDRLARSCGIKLTRALIPLNLSVFVATLGAGLYVYFIPLYAQKFGGSFLDLGFIGAAYAVAYAIGPIFVGYVADRVNRAWLYSLGIMFIALSSITLVAARSVTDIAVIRASAGLAFAFFWPTSEVLVAEFATDENRLKEMGVYSVFWALGFLIGPVAGGVVLETYGYSWLFITSFILIALALAISVTWVVPKHTTGIGHKPKENSSNSLSTIRSLAPWYGVIVCYGIIANVVLSIFPGYANLVGIAPAFIGTLFSVYYSARIVMFALMGRLRRFEETKLLLIISAIFSVGTIILGIFSGLDGFIVGMMLLGCCSGTMFPVMINLISRHFPSEKMGVAVGSYETTFGVGSAVGPILAGSLAVFSNVGWSFALLSIVGAVMFIFIIIGKSRT